MHQRIAFKIKETLPLLYISETTIDQSFKATIHSHSNLEILYIIDGEGFLLYEQQKNKVKKGDVIIINSNTHHQEQTNSNLHFYSLGINQLEIFNEDTFKNKVIYLNILNQVKKEIFYIYYLLFQEAKNLKDDNLIVQNLYQVLKNILIREAKLTIYNQQQKKYSSLIASTINVIDNYYYSDIKLAEIAKRFSISISTLSHQFKKEVGTSIIDYKLNCQIDEAKNLLSITDMSISQISLTTGFNSSAYFTKIFKIKTSMTPKEYRKKYSN